MHLLSRESESFIYACTVRKSNGPDRWTGVVGGVREILKCWCPIEEMFSKKLKKFLQKIFEHTPDYCFKFGFAEAGWSRNSGLFNGKGHSMHTDSDGDITRNIFTVQGTTVDIFCKLPRTAKAMKYYTWEVDTVAFVA